MWDSGNFMIIIKVGRIFKKYVVKKELDYYECMLLLFWRCMCNEVYDIVLIWIIEIFF